MLRAGMDSEVHFTYQQTGAGEQTCPQPTIPPSQIRAWCLKHFGGPGALEGAQISGCAGMSTLGRLHLIHL